MAELTPDDVRHWDLSVIHQMFETVGKLRGSHHELGEALVNGHKRTANWHGESAEAFRQELGKTRTDVDATGRESDGVYNAVRTAEMWVSGCKASIDDIDATAKGYGWKVTQDWKIDTSKNPPEIGFDDSMAVQQELLQTELTKLKDHAQIADRDLALALRAAVGDAQVDAHGHEVGGHQPQPQPPPPPPAEPHQNASGSVGGPDGNPPYANGATATMAPAAHTVPLAENPPGFPPVGPGAQRDQNWTNYLNGQNADGSHRTYGQLPAALPRPEAVSDPRLRTIGAAGRQQGVSYAWGANQSVNGPTKGTLQGDPPGGEAHKYHDDKRIGFDCGGLARYSVYQGYGNIDLGAGTGNQWSKLGGTSAEISNPLPGDLLYWGAGGSDHVAINLGNGAIIQTNASGTGAGLSTIAAQDAAEGEPHVVMRPH